MSPLLWFRTSNPERCGILAANDADHVLQALLFGGLVDVLDELGSDVQSARSRRRCLGWGPIRYFRYSSV
jgi:hypothetical protein